MTLGVFEFFQKQLVAWQGESPGLLGTGLSGASGKPWASYLSVFCFPLCELLEHSHANVSRKVGVGCVVLTACLRV